jgi:transposase InsO family protein
VAVSRFLIEGVGGLRDRSSRPHSSPSQTVLATCDAVESLRRQRNTQEQIAHQIGISKSTVSRILKRRGLSLLSALEPQQPRPRYERASPGELIHLDIKKLGRFNGIGYRITKDRAGHTSTGHPGWECVHVAIDDHSRVAIAEIFPDQKKESAVAFLLQTVAYFARLGVSIDRVMTDNGSCYRSKAFARACKQLGIKHILTKPYTPQTNGKADDTSFRVGYSAVLEAVEAHAAQSLETARVHHASWRHGSRVAARGASAAAGDAGDRISRPHIGRCRCLPPGPFSQGVERVGL